MGKKKQARKQKLLEGQEKIDNNHGTSDLDWILMNSFFLFSVIV